MLRKRILLIDDNQSLLDAYQNILTNEGFHVDIADSGELGLDILKKYDHQIVITDIRFPACQMDGFKIIEAAKKLNPDCEVIVITGYSDLELAIKAMHLDASDFIPKPCRKKDLMLAIKRASEKLEMRRLVREYTETLKSMLYKKEQEIANIEAKLIHTARLTAMGEMAASICHELRQPLCGIMGFTYLVAENISEDSQAREYLNKVQEQINHMEHIVNNMRIFSRKSDAGFILLSVNDVVRSTISLFSHQFRNNGIELTDELDEAIPLIIGNRVKLQQVFINLLSNARDALEDVQDRKDKMISIKTSYDPADKKVKITISDNGIGIEEALYTKIFQSFFTTKGEDRGTGLGLSVSSSIVSDHEGEINVTSQKGLGSTFTVILPAKKQIDIEAKIIDDSERFIGEAGELGAAF